MLKECSEEYINKIRQYVLDVVEAEKGNLPGAKKMEDRFTWEIIKVASKKAMKDIYAEFEKILSLTKLEYTEPEGTSFRIIPPETSHTFQSGVAKIIVSIDLQRNDNIVRRVKNKDYIIEVSLHGEKENYLSSTYLGYYRNNYIRFFDSENFNENIKNAASEVQRILTHQEFSDKSKATQNFY